jgi:hypothetical protein
LGATRFLAEALGSGSCGAAIDFAFAFGALFAFGAGFNALRVTWLKFDKPWGPRMRRAGYNDMGIWLNY